MSNSADHLEDAITRIEEICNEPSSKSQLFFYGSYAYKSGIRRFLESSSDVASAVVEPGTVDALSKIMKVLGDTKVPFGVSCGGHNTNPGFSSTKGIQISLSRLDKVHYGENTDYVDAEAGCLFDQVYRKVLAKGRNVVGATANAGVGVSGWLLGGGYSSAKTSQYGLGIDNIHGIKIVLTDGTVVDTTRDDPDQDKRALFWAVLGGGNNFGIVARFTLKTYPQSPTVYARSLPYGTHKADKVKKAIVNFVDGFKDKKAGLEVFFRYGAQPGVAGYQSQIAVNCYYDGSLPQDNPFKEFLDIPPDGKATDHESNTSYLRFEEEFSAIHDRLLFDNTFDHIDLGILGGIEPNDQSIGSELVINRIPTYAGSLKPMKGVGENARGRWGCVMLGKYTRKLIDEAEKQTKAVAENMDEHSGLMLVFDIWPFHPGLFDNSSSTAWPHERGKPNMPFHVTFLWTDEKEDDYWVGKMEEILKAVEEVVRGDDEKEFPDMKDKRPIYSNLALPNTPIEKIYRGNLETLQKYRAMFDRGRVMNQAGGFRIP